MKSLFDPRILLVLGLAPFFPEPHIWGKFKCIVGGANGMQFMDWMDVMLHGTHAVVAAGREFDYAGIEEEIIHSGSLTINLPA